MSVKIMCSERFKIQDSRFEIRRKVGKSERRRMRERDKEEGKRERGKRRWGLLDKREPTKNPRNSQAS